LVNNGIVLVLGRWLAMIRVQICGRSGAGTIPMFPRPKAENI
jgi:hypothetical protein